LRAPDSTEIDLIITQAMCIYTTLRSLNKWASERGDEFAISQVGWIDERGLIEPKGSACVAVIINGREAIPVRAIPYVTGWDVSPDRLAKSLAHTPGGVRLDRLTAYHADGERGPIWPKEWDGIVDRLKGLAASLEVENSNREITRPQWLKKSVPILPAGVFVWKDELEKSFSRFSAETGTLEGDHPDDGKLNFSPLIPGRMREKVMKGFVKDAAPKQTDDAAIERSRVPAVTEIAPTTDAAVLVPAESQEQTGTAHSGATEVVPAGEQSEEATPTTVHFPRPMPQHRFQENEILRIIHELGYDAQAIPKWKPGTRGAKAKVRGNLKFSEKVFDKAWQRLREDSRISEAG
jgi:hypothetical protein